MASLFSKKYRQIIYILCIVAVLFTVFTVLPPSYSSILPYSESQLQSQHEADVDQLAQAKTNKASVGQQLDNGAVGYAVDSQPASKPQKKLTAEQATARLEAKMKAKAEAKEKEDARLLREGNAVSIYDTGSRRKGIEKKPTGSKGYKFDDDTTPELVKSKAGSPEVVSFSSSHPDKEDLSAIKKSSTTTSKTQDNAKVISDAEAKAIADKELEEEQQDSSAGVGVRGSKSSFSNKNSKESK